MSPIPGWAVVCYRSYVDRRAASQAFATGTDEVVLEWWESDERRRPDPRGA